MSNFQQSVPGEGKSFYNQFLMNKIMMEIDLRKIKIIHIVIVTRQQH